jgi:hypothetical protein
LCGVPMLVVGDAADADVLAGLSELHDCRPVCPVWDWDEVARALEATAGSGGRSENSSILVSA